ncbi:MAG: sugar kinase [Gemmatimonas sp.]|nr:sugar kinase [Gemmatimonas sp.]
MSILVVGSVAYDTVETPRERRERQLGGSASFFSLAASRFAPVRAVGVVGDDFRAADLALLAARGVDTAGILRRGGPTFHWSGRYHEDLIERDTLATELGVFQDFAPELPAGWRETPYLFLANIHPSLQADVLDRMVAPRLVVLDTMNLWIKTTRRELQEVLARVDVVLLNDGEARLLSGQRSLAAAATAIRELGPARVVIKKGEHGALLFGRDSLLAVPALLLPEVVDPTGAGDCFAGGFVGHLAASGAKRDDGDPVFRQAMLAGTAVASACPEAFSVDGILALDEAGYARRLATLAAMMTP